MRRAAAVLLLILMTSGTAHAQSPEDVAARVSEEVMSPFCDGVTLHDCPSGAADALRRRIVSMARSGMTEEQIVSALKTEYGNRIEPSPDNPLSWTVPATAALAGIALIIVLARRWTSRDATGDLPPISEGDRARLEAELGAHRGQS
jgi:cytochrome c-type biogenesis protein CcmH/NrfF